MRITLQHRITTITIIFVVVLIASFTVVQLQNQLRVITIFNSLKAKLTAQILKDSIQSDLRDLGPGEDHAGSLASSLKSLEAAGLIDSAFVYSADGIIKASTTSVVIGKRASAIESQRIEEAKRGKLEGKNYYSYIYKATRTLQLYFPVNMGDAVPYVARIDFSLGNMAEAMKQVYGPVIIIAIIVIMATFFFGHVLSKRVIGPISLLNTASKELASGDLNLRIHMDTNDELQNLADTFNFMAIELKKMKAKAENANPLTKLPGNIVIQEEVELCIRNNKKFMVIYCDLDNFKAFNDKYGIHKGDDAIKLTASIFKEAMEQKGNRTDFIGHEGGDDFLLLTTPDRAKGIGDYISSEFDKKIGVFYNKEDMERGYIEAKSRHGDQIMKFPIMTISLAGITNEIRPFTSYGEVTNVAAEMKKKAKNTEGSCLVIDQRKVPWPPGMPRPT